jgi:hypothetical protein
MVRRFACELELRIHGGICERTFKSEIKNMRYEVWPDNMTIEGIPI